MILLDNQTQDKIDIKKINNICQYLKITRDLELIITDDKNIKKLNKEHREIDKATDVLSFPLEDIEFAPLGSIVISIDMAKKVANSLKHSVDDEIALLFIHGLLHILGYEHEANSTKMRKKEEEIIEHFNLPKSLIVRAEGEV